MGVRVAADDMPSLGEQTQVIGVEEARASDERARDEKVSAPAISLEELRRSGR